MKNCGIISDTHLPYQHRDALAFIRAVGDEYGIELWKHSGDLADNHTASYHEIEYGTLSAREEFQKARMHAGKLAEIVGDKMTVVLGNHCKLNHRKAKTAGIAEEVLKSYNDVYGVNWNWVDHDYFKIDKDNNCLLVHRMSGNTLSNAQRHSHCTIQGHHHSLFGIEYFADKETIRWSMTVGCLIDPHSPAFNYAAGSTTNRPILGMGTIIEDRPYLVPMVLNKSGRWNNKVSGVA